MSSRDYLCMACGKIVVEYDFSDTWAKSEKTPRCSCGHRTIRMIAQTSDSSDFDTAMRIKKLIPRIKLLNGCRKELSDHYARCSAELDRINAEIKTIAKEDAEIGRELDAIQAEIRAAEGKND